VAEKVRRSCRSVLIPDISRSEFRETSIYKSGLMVAITDEDQFQGTLSVYNKFSYTSFSTMVSVRTIRKYSRSMHIMSIRP